MLKIPVYRPVIWGNEKKYLCQAIDEGMLSSKGRFVREFEEAFAKYMGTKYAVAVCNGTAAVETMVGTDKPYHVQLTNSTIISCYIAIKRCNVCLYLKDISLTDGCVDISQGLLVHSFGNEAKATSTQHTEDRSQMWAKRPVLNAACYSLYANKMITSGEGGVIITNSKKAYNYMCSYRDLCHTKQRFIHSELSYNFRMSNLQGAVALAQLEKLPEMIDYRLKVHKMYKKKLPEGTRLVNANAEIPWMTLVETVKPASKIVAKMKEFGIECRRFFYPLNRQKPINQPGTFPNSDFAWRYWFYLPSSVDLSNKEINYICLTLGSILNTTT